MGKVFLGFCWFIWGFFLFVFFFFLYVLLYEHLPTPLFFCHLIVATAAQLRPSAILKNNRNNAEFPRLEYLNLRSQTNVVLERGVLSNVSLGSIY